MKLDYILKSENQIMYFQSDILILLYYRSGIYQCRFL